MGAMLAGAGGSAGASAGASAAGGAASGAAAGAAASRGVGMLSALSKGLIAGGKDDPSATANAQVPNLLSRDSASSGREMRNALLLQALQSMKR